MYVFISFSLTLKLVLAESIQDKKKGYQMINAFLFLRNYPVFHLPSIAVAHVFGSYAMNILT